MIEVISLLYEHMALDVQYISSPPLHYGLVLERQMYHGSLVCNKFNRRVISAQIAYNLVIVGFQR